MQLTREPSISRASGALLRQDQDHQSYFSPSYDGAGPDAYFYIGERGEPSGNGIHIADDKGTLEILGTYRNEDIVLTLPGGKTLRTIRWLSVWCDAFGVNFGEVRIPRQLRYPRPQKIRAFDGIHDVASDKCVIFLLASDVSQQYHMMTGTRCITP